MNKARTQARCFRLSPLILVPTYYIIPKLWSVSFFLLSCSSPELLAVLHKVCAVSEGLVLVYESGNMCLRVHISSLTCLLGWMSSHSCVQWLVHVC